MQIFLSKKEKKEKKITSILLSIKTLSMLKFQAYTHMYANKGKLVSGVFIDFLIYTLLDFLNDILQIIVYSQSKKFKCRAYLINNIYKSYRKRNLNRE